MTEGNGVKMVVVKISRKADIQPMEFAFETEMDAFNFYADAKSTYREEDLVIEMEGENDGYKSND